MYKIHWHKGTKENTRKSYNRQCKKGKSGYCPHSAVLHSCRDVVFVFMGLYANDTQGLP